MSRPTSRSWFRVVLATALFVAIVVVQFRLVSGPLSLIVGGGTMSSGSFAVSDIATLVMMMIAVYMAIFIADCRRGFGLFPALAALPSDARRLFEAFSVFMLAVMTMFQAGTVYMAGNLSADAVAKGGDIAAPVDLVPGLSFAIGDPILTALGCLLPICMIALVFVLVSQTGGPSSPAAASPSEGGPTVTRL